ncbi:MAG: hypothetical protein QNK04_05475 [Myxococcota bacterium]|nr:hypothetical protein [Myxococcota bacterium]
MTGAEGNAADLTITITVSIAALLAVWLPFFRGMRVCLRGFAATRRVPRSQLEAKEQGSARNDSLALLMVRVLRKAWREDKEHPREFVLDATKQYVLNEWESHYSGLISMYANILPPIGFIGTTGGLLVLFISMHLSQSGLELGALAVALTSSIFALIAFAALESMKIRLYGRLLACLDDVTALVRTA